MEKKRIAVIGTGSSGLFAAALRSCMVNTGVTEVIPKYNGKNNPFFIPGDGSRITPTKEMIHITEANIRRNFGVHVDSDIHLAMMVEHPNGLGKTMPKFDVVRRAAIDRRIAELSNFNNSSSIKKWIPGMKVKQLIKQSLTSIQEKYSDGVFYRKLGTNLEDPNELLGYIIPRTLLQIVDEVSSDVRNVHGKEITDKLMVLATNWFHECYHHASRWNEEALEVLPRRDGYIPQLNGHIYYIAFKGTELTNMGMEEGTRSISVYDGNTVLMYNIKNGAVYIDQDCNATKLHHGLHNFKPISSMDPVIQDLLNASTYGVVNRKHLLNFPKLTDLALTGDGC